jgi:hypothetical protein
MTKTKIAVLATLATLIAAPAFAGDNTTATELQDSGRYVPQAHVLTSIPSGAYASAQKEQHVRVAPVINSESQDFQLGGR